MQSDGSSRQEDSIEVIAVLMLLLILAAALFVAIQYGMSVGLRIDPASLLRRLIDLLAPFGVHWGSGGR